MHITMKKSSFIKLLSFIIAAFIILGIYTVTTAVREREYEMQVNALYRESMADLSDTLSELDYDLQKSAYAVTPYQSVLLAADVRQKSALSKAALDRLPVSGQTQSEISKFLAQTGDYAFMLAKKVISDQEVTESERSNMQRLAGRANELSVFLSDLQNQILEQNVSGKEMLSVIENSVAFAESSVTALAQPEEQSGEETQQLPTLIYDGPFSDNVFNKESVFLKDKASVSDEQAGNVAAYILDVPANSMELKSKVDSAAMRTLYFSGNDADIYITEKGGYCYSFYRSHEVDKANISAVDAVETARQFLEKIGYANMTDTYYYTENNIVTINFAYCENNILCYPDLIKVGVALDNGAVVSLDACAYLTNHVSRELKPVVERDAAVKTLSSSLQINGDRYAVIPTAGGYEQFCYEFNASASDGTQLLIYINAQTGREEQFLILLTDANGTLTV